MSIYLYDGLGYILNIWIKRRWFPYYSLTVDQEYTQIV